MNDETKVAIVTGASRGIGKAIAEALSDGGYNTVLAARRPDVLGDATGPHGNAVQAVRFDATDKASARLLVEETTARFGRLDVLVNCAGVLRESSLDDDREDEIDEMFEVNFKAPLRLVRAALPHLRRAGSGRVVNVASLSGKRVKGISMGYSASKHAVVALTHSVRFAGWEDGVRATAICPGFVNTDMVKGLSPLEPDAMTQPEDIARLVRTVIELPNNASVAELNVNCVLESSY